MAVNNSAIISQEACASISDSMGNLLFYTNGDTIWCSDNSIMPNGIGLSGRGNIQQGVLIVPLPDSTKSLYYVFTIGNTGSSKNNELRYSIIDMSLNNGLGGVSEKNIFLDSNVTEKLTATKNYDDTDFWVVEKNYSTNAFKSYALTQNGLNTVPVISNVGVPIEDSDFSGAIKISNNGCWLISTIRGLNGDAAVVELFHFDNTMGVVYNGVYTEAIKHPYGLEFSPDNGKFYIGENAKAPIWQFNLDAGDEQDDINSVIAVSDSIDTSYDYQLAPDNKIYIVTNDSTTLLTIENPNAYGTDCDLLNPGVVGLNKNTFCLPNNFNLIYPGILSCSAGLQCFDADNLLMANVFTPNGDGYNDCYGIKFKHEDSLHIIDFAIYDRWGNQVFYTTNPNDCWDGDYKGQKADEANYVFYIRLRTPCGMKAKKGNVALIR